MDRRGFLQSILALGAAPAIVRATSLMKVSGIILPTDEEIFELAGIPLEFTSSPGYPFLTPSMITREALKILEKNLIAANLVNRKFDKQLTKIGSTIRIRSPRFSV